MDNIFEKTEKLIGNRALNQISKANILLIGLGGVGGAVLESLVRTGFKNIVVVDYDKVDATNLNRQVLYNFNDIGKNKVDCAISYAKKINPDVNISGFNKKIDHDFDIFSKLKIDFIIDAIDDTKAKANIAKYASLHNIPFIMSLGMAKRKDPSKVFITRLDKTTNDPLARKLRHELKIEDLDTKKIMVVVSSENPQNCGKELPSIITVPVSAGLNITYYIINYFTNNVL